MCTKHSCLGACQIWDLLWGVFLCSSCVCLHGAAVIWSVAASLVYCTSCRRERECVCVCVCVCHSLIRGSLLETWRQCTHGRAWTLQTDREIKCAPGLISYTSLCKVDLYCPGHVLIHARVKGEPSRHFIAGYGASGWDQVREANQKQWVRVWVCVCMHMIHVCVCVWERERER